MEVVYMINVRWRKVLGDLWLNKIRTLLAVLAIAIGIFGVGTVLTGYSILTHEINANFLGTNPASAILYTDNADDKLAAVVESLPGLQTLNHDVLSRLASWSDRMSGAGSCYL